jgi:hypothetical protein
MHQIYSNKDSFSTKNVAPSASNNSLQKLQELIKSISEYSHAPMDPYFRASTSCGDMNAF